MHGRIDNTIRFIRPIAIAATLVAMLQFAFSADAQLLRGRLRPQEPEVEAYVGEPYGVGRWTVQLPQGVNPALLGNSGFTLTEKNGRALFQAFQAEPLRTVLREFSGRPQMTTVYFLFTGPGPLELQLHSPTAVSSTVMPRRDPVGQQRLLTDWWARYTRQANRIDRGGDYPDLVDNYLLATLSRRLNLPPASQMPPPPIRLIADGLLSSVMGGSFMGGASAPRLPSAETGDAQFDDEIGLLLGGDGLRSEMQTRVLERRNDAAETANQPLPTGLGFSAKVPEVLEEVQIEPIAQHVPAECFYIRFGNFSNYLWFRHTLDRWSGDLRNLVNRRGLDFGMNQRIERQLSLKESILAPLLGPAVIVDNAMIGTDLFFREGASMGMLYQARNNVALNTDFTNQRAATKTREAGCVLEDIEIAGHKVSFLHTPDNRVRSFYAIDGDYHFVTNSRRLVERFFEAGAGKDALAGTAEFRYARSLMPGSRGYSVFAYLSGEFFRNLTGPQYQIEMARRLWSAAEIDMALVAKWAARGEGREAKSLNDLVKSQFLPAGFGQRWDGSRLEMTEAGEFVDSLRGARGSFIPAIDVAIEQVTPAEAKRYQEFVTWFQAKWSQIDPVLAGIRREPSRLKEPGVERIVLDVQLTPLAAQNYESLARMFGPVSKQRLTAVPGDIVSGEAVLSGSLLSSRGQAAPQGPYRVFGALRNEEPEVAAAPGGAAAGQPSVQIDGRGPIPVAQIAGALLGGPAGSAGGATSSILPPFYIGSYPSPAPLAWLGLGEVPLDVSGYGRTALGLWQLRSGNFTIASFQRAVLGTVAPQLRLVDALRPGQAWFHAGDVGRSKLAGLINGLFYRSAKSAAVGNVRFLQSLSTQLRVAPKDSLTAAEQLTDARFVCPVGGTYQLDERTGGPARWTTTALTADRMRLIDGLFEPAPTDFTAPMLNWLRNLDADVSLDQRVLSFHAEIEMQQQNVASNGNATKGGVGKGGTQPPAAPSGFSIPGLPSLTVPPAPVPSSTPPAKATPPQSKPSAEELPPPVPQPAR